MWKDKALIDNDRNIFVKNLGKMRSKDLYETF